MLNFVEFGSYFTPNYLNELIRLWFFLLSSGWVILPQVSLLQMHFMNTEVMETFLKH